MLRKFTIKRTTVLAAVFICMSLVLVRQLYLLQIIQGQDYINEFESRITRRRVLKSTRGNIYDRNGEPLATNVLAYSVTLEDNGTYATGRERSLTLNGTAYRLLKILEKNGDSLTRNFHIIMDENGEYTFDVEEGFTLDRFRADIYGHPLIDELTQEERNATAAQMVEFLSGGNGFSIVLYGKDAYTAQELAAHQLPGELTREEILDIAIIRYALSTNSYKKYMPVTVASHVSEESVAAIMENQAQLQGIAVVEDSVRRYVDEMSMGPVLGYTGRASQEELEELQKKDPSYSNDAIIGKAGMEQYMESYLHGRDGEETVYVDNLGKVLKIEEDTRVASRAGRDVYLTIDTHWQKGIYEILKQRVAGILLSKIEAVKDVDLDELNNAALIPVPIYDVYNALVANSVIDINQFSREDASETEKALYAKFQEKQQEVFDRITDRLSAASPPAYRDEDEQMQEYLSYICSDLLRDTLKILSANAVDTSDQVYKAWAKEESISLKEYLTYAAGQGWIDISKIAPEGEYLDSGEVYRALAAYLTDYLKTDTSFSKLLYKYMLFEDTISGRELCLALYEQGILPKEDEAYEELAAGTLSAYDFMVRKIANLEIEPAQLALMPCSASAVITDVHTGEVLACVSYPGYDNNRLANNMDTEYYAKLALDLSSPFFNKATQQRTAPGSTLKLLSAVAGMMEGVIDDDTYVECTGAFDLVEPPIHCWNLSGHGTIGIREAIEQSCNYFFNTVGYRLGQNEEGKFSESQSLAALRQYASLMGLDKKSGIELSEASPQVSDESAVRSYMGQGTHLYTTSQLARYAATLANSGTVYDLTLLDRVEDGKGTVEEEFEPREVGTLEIPDNVWEDIHDGMYRVVQTHEQFDGLGMDVAGKTGTAEIDIYHPNHGLFVGYAPASGPEYAIAVRIANGYSSGNACLAASDIFKYIFELEDEEQIITGAASSDVSNVSND